jgi:hypothetical protein
MNWKDAEKCVAELFGGRTQPGSGCVRLERRGVHRKDDVISKKFLIEVKFSKRGRYRVKAEVLHGVIRRAAKLGLVPMFAAVFPLGSRSAVVFFADATLVLAAIEASSGRSVEVAQGRPWRKKVVLC